MLLPSDFIFASPEYIYLLLLCNQRRWDEYLHAYDHALLSQSDWLNCF